MRKDWSFEECGQYSTLAPVTYIYSRNEQQNDK